MRVKLTLNLFIICCILLSSCNNSKLIKQTGYIVFNYAEDFQFVPVKKLDLKTSISSFNSENLEKGIMFSSELLGNYYDTIFSHIDTFRLENFDSSFGIKIRTLKIVPVSIEYEIDKSTISKNVNKINFTVKGRSVHYVVQFCKPIIKNITTLGVNKLNKEGNYYEDISICPRPPRN